MKRLDTYLTIGCNIKGVGFCVVARIDTEKGTVAIETDNGHIVYQFDDVTQWLFTTNRSVQISPRGD